VEGRPVPDIVLAKAYAQVNTVKGWQYLDDAGKVMNRYEDTFPDMSIGPQGLVMRNPVAAIDEARVSGRDIWIGFTRPDTVRYVIDQSWSFISFVAATISVTQATRFGLRLQYIVPRDDLTNDIDATAAVLFATAFLVLQRRLLTI
jgi:hypothetical protein